jgi:hypothetical protein
LFDGPWQTAEFAGTEWLTIREVAEEIARQLHTEVAFGPLEGSEAPVDPEHLLPQWEPQISLSHGLSCVIADGREFLEREAFTRTSGRG